MTARGVGFAIRLLATFQATIDTLNLHPSLKKLVSQPHGLILLSGPTGSGKSSTLAALIQEINLTETRHVVTIESPIEYTFRPRHAYIRQREVGRDTPSFEQALLDPADEPTKDSSLQGGKRLSALLGITFHPQAGLLKGQHFHVLGEVPIVQSLDGPQLRRRWLIRCGWQLEF